MLERRPHKTEIDDLILFEQQVNLVNGPVVLMQLLRDASYSVRSRYQKVRWSG